MELKKFEAPTLAQALQVVKRELGPEAVILSTKNNKSGFGLLTGTSVEVTAAVSPEALERKRLAERKLRPDQKESLSQRPAQKVIQAYDILSGRRIERENSNSTSADRLAQAVESQRSAVQAPQNRQRPATQRRYVDIRDDESPAEQAATFSVDRSRISAPARHVAPAPVAAHTPSSPLLPRFIAGLLDTGMEQELIKDLSDELKLIMVREQITKEDVLRMQLARIIMSRLRVARPLSERLRIPSTPRMITFVGPTGVGKTTTIAKIAAELVISQQRPVTLATTDTFKIAAVEQLQTYANILRVPLEVCPTQESLMELAHSLNPENVVLIDTAGYGPKDEKKLQELRDTLSGIRSETHLCVGAMTRDRDLNEIVKHFKIFNPDYLVMTKLDETSSFGNLYNISVKSHLPLSYLTMGQRVPEDMEIATKERVADLLLNISGGV